MEESHLVGWDLIEKQWMFMNDFLGSLLCAQQVQNIYKAFVSVSELVCSLNSKSSSFWISLFIFLTTSIVVA